MTDILKDFEAAKKQLADLNAKKENEHLAVERAERERVRKRNEAMEELTFRMENLLREYPEVCKQHAPWIRTKMGRAVEIVAGRSKDYSGT